jgi:hypothetical protein
VVRLEIPAVFRSGGDHDRFKVTVGESGGASCRPGRVGPDQYLSF